MSTTPSPTFQQQQLTHLLHIAQQSHHALQQSSHQLETNKTAYEQTLSHKNDLLKKNQILKEMTRKIMEEIMDENEVLVGEVLEGVGFLEGEVCENDRYRGIIGQNPSGCIIPKVNFRVRGCDVPEGVQKYVNKFIEQFKAEKASMENDIMKQKIIIKLAQIDLEENYKKSQSRK